LAKSPAPRISSATSALDKDSIMPVVRVRFKSANGKLVKETFSLTVALAPP
jgi:hypothetical protein